MTICLPLLTGRFRKIEAEGEEGLESETRLQKGFSSRVRVQIRKVEGRDLEGTGGLIYRKRDCVSKRVREGQRGKRGMEPKFVPFIFLVGTRAIMEPILDPVLLRARARVQA